MKRRVIISAAGLAAAVPALWAQGGPAGNAAKRGARPVKLVFGLITPRSAELMLKNWNPFFDRMSHAIGMPIERRTYAAAGDLVKDFTSGNLDLAWLGNAPALEIVESGTGSVFAVEVVQGATAYRIAVARKEIDVATNNTSELANFKTSRPDEAALVRTIWESPDIPTSPMVWRNDLAPAIKQQVAAFAERFGKDDEEKGILWSINKLTGWRSSTNRQLIPIADVEMFNARQRIMNDATLSAEERVRRVDEVTRRGSKLELLIRASV